MYTTGKGGRDIRVKLNDLLIAEITVSSTWKEEDKMIDIKSALGLAKIAIICRSYVRKRQDLGKKNYAWTGVR